MIHAGFRAYGHCFWGGLTLATLFACGSSGGDTYAPTGGAGGTGGATSGSGGESSSDGGTSSPDGGTSGGAGAGAGGSNQGGASGDAGAGAVAGTSPAGGSAGVGGGGGQGGAPCGGAADFVFVIDNSGSMVEEITAIETVLNQGFAQILDASGLDYQVVVISRHREDERAVSEIASTSICVSQPLSALATCPAVLPAPTTRFKHYGTKVESFDVLDWILTAYDTAPEVDDYAALAPNGYGPWLRPDSHTAFIVVTDDDESNDVDIPLTSDAFLTQLTALSSAHFGTADSPTFALHSVVGLQEKPAPASPYLPDEPIQTGTCTANGAAVESYAPTYQELSLLTGGLRFPICQFQDYAAMLDAVVDAAVARVAEACPRRRPTSR